MPSADAEELSSPGRDRFVLRGCLVPPHIKNERRSETESCRRNLLHTREGASEGGCANSWLGTREIWCT